MWIIPTSLHPSLSARVTEGLTSDLNELSDLCARSLMWRSTLWPAQTWSRRWKRVSWLQHLSGRILRPSQASSFTDSWTSSQRATLASRSALPAHAKGKTTPATYGPTYRGQLQLFALDASSLRTSPDTLPPGLVTSCTTWVSWVTALRQDCLRRQNAARYTKENESSSSALPTPTVPGSHQVGTLAEWGGSNNPLRQPAPAHTNTDGSRQEQWTTPQAHDVSPGKPERLERYGTKHGCRNLNDQVAKWGTPRVTTNGCHPTTESGGGDLQAAAGGALNPRWVETLMSLPIGWTMPSCANPVIPVLTNSGSVEMESIPRLQRKLSKPSTHN